MARKLGHSLYFEISREMLHCVQYDVHGILAILFRQDFYERIDPSAAPQGDGGLANILQI
ncbi:MAG: hypothetical protein NT027_04495 [Proteobacteria bacterium]|nr:hypothetical protein [Pseudomonadota bacterium]